VIEVPVDFVEFERRLGVIERRLDEYEDRDQQLLEVIAAVQRLSEVMLPLIKSGLPPIESPRPAGAPSDTSRSSQDSSFASALTSDRVAPERLERAQARLRETLFVDTESEASTVTRPDAPTASSPARRRKKWLLRTFKRMVKEDPPAAGRLLVALLPAHELAELPALEELPWPPTAIARLVVAGRLRRRIGWERAGLECRLSTVSAMSRLVRLRTSPAELHAAGVRLDAYLAFSLVALSIEPVWTVGSRFTIAHSETAADAPDAYLTVRDGDPLVVGTEPPAVPVATTISCDGPALVGALVGEQPSGVTISGEGPALADVQRWFASATSC
jgi:hypothetical protein